MILSATSQHAIRALVHLAQVPPGESILGRELAEIAGIPPNFLSKIMLTLRNAGLVDATRGQGGGYRMARSADQITLMQIVDLFDGTNGRPRCFLGEKHSCCDEEACAAHAGWKVVCDAYLNFLNGNTIAEIGLQSQRLHPALHSLSL